MYTRGHSTPTRALELLEALKAELENAYHELNIYKVKAVEYEAQLQKHRKELHALQTQIAEIEAATQSMRILYETEIMHLRRQLESANLTPSTTLDSRSFILAPSLFSAPSFPIANPAVLGGIQQPHMHKGITTPTPVVPLVAPSKRTGSSNKMDVVAPANSSSLSQLSASTSIPAGSTTGINTAAGLTAFAPVAPNVLGGGGGINRPEKEAVDQKMSTSSTGLAANPESPKQSSVIQSPRPSRKGNEMQLKSDFTASTSSPKSISTTTEGGSAMDVSNDQSAIQIVDWACGYNPHAQKKLEIDLLLDLEHSSVVCAVKFSPDGKYLATGCNYASHIFDAETGKRLHSYTIEPSSVTTDTGDLYIRSVCFSPDSQYLVTAAEDKTVKVWDIEKKVIKHNLYGHDLDIYSLDFSRDGRFIVSGSGDKKIKIWDVASGKCVHTLGNDEVGPKDGVTSVAFSPDGRLVAAGSLDKIVRIWDAETGYFLDRFEGHTDSVYSVAFDTEGKSLASGSLDRTIKLWDLSSRSRSRCRSTLVGHKDFVLSVAFTPDGNWLVSASKDRHVHFWELKSYVLHMMLHGHKNSVISVSVTGSEDGTGRFATGSGDSKARIWGYRSGQFSQ